MTLTSNLKTQIDTPVWEWCRFFPAANSAISEMCAIETPDSRYMYMLVSSTFFRYDTYTDVWITLAPPVTAPLLILSLKYLPFAGYTGKVISATANTLTSGLRIGKFFEGNIIRIISGTGNGQERTITVHGDAVIADSGICTTGGSTTITDTTKKWDINQWAGYQCKIVNFIGQSQVRKILYNTATVLTFQDLDLQPFAPEENNPFVTAATAASVYTIESNVLTVDSNWTVQPNGTSKYRILTGVIACLSTVAAAPFQSFQVYDIASDVWYTQSCQTLLLPNAGAAANDISFVRLGEGEVGVFDSGTATVAGSSTRALGDSSKNWTVDQWSNYELKITGGAGVGTIRRILANTASILYVDGAMTLPNATSTYVIRPLRCTILSSGWGLATMLGYNIDSDLWSQSFISDNGLANVMSVRAADSPPVACTGTRATTGITAIVAAPTNGGTGYIVGDVLTCNTGTGGLLIVTSTTGGGVVTGLKLQKAGNGYFTGAGKTTTGGSGGGNCTFEITSTGTIGVIATAIAHRFSAGDSIIYGGANDAAWNTTYTVLCTSSTSTLDVIITAAGSAAATTAASNTVIVDGSKAWTINEHAGKIVQISAFGVAGVSQMRKITSNTAIALTIYGSVLSGTPVEGHDRYVIYDPNAFGTAVQDKCPTRTNTGWCTSSVDNLTLTDNTKAWRGNQWLGYKVRVICGTGFDKVQPTITSNTATALIVSGGFGYTPDTTTKYIIEDTYGVPTTVTNTTNAVVTDTTKNWVVNQWSGFRIRITAGEGVSLEMPITSNTATALTITGVFTTTPVALSSMYTILGVPVRSAGHELMWASNTTTNAGRYVISPRGGTTNLFDRFNVSTNTWDLTFSPSPDTETFAVGTMYAYDGGDRIYIQKDTTGRIMYMDLSEYRMQGGGTMPYVIGTTGIGAAVNGNRMEIIQTADGLKFLYVMKHTGAALSATGGGTEMFRMLIFW